MPIHPAFFPMIALVLLALAYSVSFGVLYAVLWRMHAIWQLERRPR